MESVTPLNTVSDKMVNQMVEDGGTTPKSPLKQKRGDQTALIQGLKIVYDCDAQALRPKKGKNVAHLSQTKSTGVTETEQIVDIVAVPGLGADPSITWLRRRPVESKQDKKKGRDGPLFADGPSCIEDKSMLQAQIPNSRIMIFQYASQWWGEGAVSQHLHQVAENLIRALRNKREKCPKRPIIFIGHSLGGIVIEKAILCAKMGGGEYADIINSVSGCIFLGTPFMGSKSQSYAAFVARAAEVAGKGDYNSLLEVLKSGNQYLESTRHDFLALVDEVGILTHCFFELKKTNLTKFLALGWFSHEEVIAPDDIATFPGKPKTSLNVDHSGLTKFDSPTDGHWLSIYEEVKVMARKSAKLVKSRQNALPEKLDDNKFQEILNALTLSESNPDDDIAGVKQERREAIEATTKLLLGKIKATLHTKDPSALWIKTYPGMDTSMMAVAIHQELKVIQGSMSGDQKDIHLCYFFCDDTDMKKNNTLSILKACIRQLITQTKRLILHLPWDQKDATERVTFKNAADLMEPFLAMLRDESIGNVHILINNLQMVDDDDRKQLLETFEKSCAMKDQSNKIDPSSKVKWSCIGIETGRPDIVKAMQIAQHVTPEDLGSWEERRDTLKLLVRQRVDELAKQLGYRADIVFWLRAEILRRAEGNTTWVDLACGEIKNVMPAPIKVRSFAESLRQGLTPLYQQIKKRVLYTDHPSIEYTKEILRTMMVVVQHPTPRELVILANLPDQLHPSALLDLFLACGSFLTIRKDPINNDVLRVQFVDASARDFLQNDREVVDLLGLHSKELQHGMLALRCLSYLRDHTGAGELDRDDRDPLPGRLRNGENLTIIYPSRYWITHAKQATNTDVVEDFDLEATWWHGENSFDSWWPSLSELTMQYPGLKNLTSMHLAAFFDYTPMLQKLLNSSLYSQEVHAEDSRGMQPLSCAVRQGHSESIKMLIDHGADVNFVNNKSPIPFTAVGMALARDRLDIVEYLVSRGGDIHRPRGAAVCLAAGSGSIKTVKYVLGLGAKAERPVGFRFSAIIAACYSGDVEVIQAIIETGCDINDMIDDPSLPCALEIVARNAQAIALLLKRGASKKHRQRGLCAAFHADDNDECVKMLLEIASDLDLNEPFLEAATRGRYDLFPLFSRTQLKESVLAEALAAGAEKADVEAVKMLLKMKANPNIKITRDDVLYSNVLHAAAIGGSNEIVRMLLNAKAKPYVVDEIWGTALQEACFQGNMDNVKLLLPGHSRTPPKCGSYGNPLYAAIMGNHKGIVNLLLVSGWDVNIEGGDLQRPILAAAAEARLDCMELLLARKPDLEVQDLEGRTALIISAGTLPAKVVKLLVGSSDIHKEDDNGITALMSASKARATESIKALLEFSEGQKGWRPKKLDINKMADSQGSALHIAARNGDARTCEILIQHGASLKNFTDTVPPVLYLAAMSGDFETWELVIDHSLTIRDNFQTYKKKWGDPLGAAIQGRNPSIYSFYLDEESFEVNSILSPKYGTALQAVCRYHVPELVDELIDMGADPNVRGGKYDTPLQAAAYRGDIGVVKSLLDAGAEIDTITKGGRYKAALCAAASKNHLGVMRLLIHETEPLMLSHALEYATRQKSIAAVSMLLAEGAIVPLMKDSRRLRRLMHDIDSFEREYDDMRDDNSDDGLNVGNDDNELEANSTEFDMDGELPDEGELDYHLMKVNEQLRRMVEDAIEEAKDPAVPTRDLGRGQVIELVTRPRSSMRDSAAIEKREKISGLENRYRGLGYEDQELYGSSNNNGNDDGNDDYGNDDDYGSSDEVGLYRE